MVLCGLLAWVLGKRKGYNQVAMFAIGFFLTGIGVIVALVLPDRNKHAADKADALLKYKLLLDSEAITQEEFDTKKNELMK